MAATSTTQISKFKPSDSTFIEYSRNTVNHALQENRITDDDAQLIREFVAEISATRHIRRESIQTLLYSR